MKDLTQAGFAAQLEKLDAPLNRRLILDALAFAVEAHKEQKRMSGEPYVSHPIAVALLLLEMHMDTASICAGLLHDTLEDTKVTFEELSERFNETVANLVLGVTKIERLDFASRAERHAENIRRMLLAMTSDIRVILIKLADRMHNLMTLRYQPPHKQERIAQETLDIYVPLAHRLGIFRIKSEMEDLCLRYLEPTVFFEIQRKVSQREHARHAFVAELQTKFQTILDDAEIPSRIKGRPKSIYSIYKKTLKRDRELNEIYDIIGLRVIVVSVQDCYKALGMIHECFRPVPGRFKDYIAVPKPNLYRSLHTTLFHPSGKIFEVQIRTEEMDQVAEQGIAAHWSYKEGTQVKEDVQKKLLWLKQILEWHKDVADSGEFVEGVKLDLFRNQSYVFTPNGNVVELPANATPIDFAYAIHTEVGHHCVGAQVNGRMVPLTYELKNGQIVNILTSKKSKGPSRDWLDVVKSARARSKIRRFLKRESSDVDMQRGREVTVDEIRRRIHALPDAQAQDLSPQKILRSDAFMAALAQFGHSGTDGYFRSIGRNEITPNSLLNSLDILKPVVDESKILTQPMAERKPARSSQGVLVGGEADMMVRLSKCCNPVIGDEIVGYITRGRGVSIHRGDCPNVRALQKDPDREIEVAWDPSLLKRDTTYLVGIEVRVHDRPNVLLKVTNIISNFKLNIYSANARVTKSGEGVLNYSIEVRNKGELGRLLEAIQMAPEVVTAYRVKPQG